ncbi:N-6 DNA methylase [Porphyromonas sp. HMSC077F02]|uniref:N-6 DNA methylase n=1 Tax=Porphyromonas sp. HMSC077F02 TaxID=1739529 RepID=UPI0008A65ECB|nr:N-6 DNA methylase [Porphyromonas sp. HMSC077F02]OFO52341.1 N-6 DNA methylase [Porphyromonas sp. HMSC077F02]
MSIREWIKENISDYSKRIKTEEDVKVHIILPYLKSLGYQIENMRFENSMSVQAGTKSVTVISDIEIVENNNIEIVIDAKAPNISLNEKEILQSISYAKLVSTPPALYAVVTNGFDVITTNIYTGKQTSEIPSRSELTRDVSRSRKRELSDIEIREVQSLMLTLNKPEELYAIIKESKDIIEKRGLIRSDQSFKEMTKILLVKMNEERRAKNGDTNRFQIDILKRLAKADDTTPYEVFLNLFSQAKQSYPIYTNPNEGINISDEKCLLSVVEKLEPWSFLGTGDDIKGAVYEIFLKSTLRGDFDQYFTPREIVDFVVKFANPNIGDKILDPACGSGGFLIQSFLYVTQKIINSPLSEVQRRIIFEELIDKCLWGGEADEDLHVLAKINLIMHGDGYNNIYQGDSLRNEKILDNHFDLVLTNPPFTIPYAFDDVLNQFELGIGRESQELDVLFVEKCVRSLKEDGELYIVLPEGLLNLPSYQYFREWIMSKCYITLSIGLPEGAFIPFGKSVSKTAILGLRKRNLSNDNKPEYVFLGTVSAVGYEVGKSTYKPIEYNDLLEFTFSQSSGVFQDIRTTKSGGEYVWLKQENVTSYRIDSQYLINSVDIKAIHTKFSNLQRLDKVCSIENNSIKPLAEQEYYYLEIPDVSPDTGTISNIRKLKGDEIGDSFNLAKGGDIAYTRINPRLNRVFIIPDEIEEVLISKEAYVLSLHNESMIISNYVLAAILQSELVKSQLIRIATGSSSSRARIQQDAFLNSVFIPIPDLATQRKIHRNMSKAYNDYWEASQKFLKNYTECQKALLTDIDINNIRKA